jgi:hypothetical protein
MQHPTFADTNCNISEQRLQHHHAAACLAQDEEGVGAEVKGEPPADVHKELDRHRERWGRAGARLAGYRPRGAAVGARPPVVEELADHHHGGEEAVERPDHDEQRRGGCPISAHTPREEAKPEGMERWSSGDHRSGLGTSGGDRRRDIRRRRRGREAAEGARGS